jgi:hypothetical protein
VIDENGTSVIVRNDDEFGHGFSICGCLIMQLLRQREKFELLDFSTHVLNIYNYECKVKNERAATADSQKLLDSRDKFVVATTYESLVHLESFSLFETLTFAPVGVEGKQISMFKPPASDI